ncbi:MULTISPECIES: hypothetical protein [Parafrankia]|nr:MULTISPECIES: hypothetical protein [Parafrankia]
MDTRTSGSAAERTPNLVLQELRKSRKWGRPRLAKELHLYCLGRQWPSPGEENLRKQIYRLETGHVRSPDEFYSRLYCQFFERTPHDLFGETRQTYEGSGELGITSHKFVPVYIGEDAATALAEGMESASGQWTECHTKPLELPDGTSCTKYVWPFGVVVYHLAESLTPESIAEVAVWRSLSYPGHIDWATRRLEERIGAQLAVEPYVLSAYWVHAVPWDEARTDTALRLLCIPRALTERAESDIPSRAHAELVEQSLVREGFDHPEITEFGMRGISLGFASWSGVVYHPTAPTRALTEQELVSCELSVQAAWSYCNYIRSEVERGSDPQVSEKYGWRFVRGLRSRLTTERPQETSQHRSMREAVIETSGLSRHLDQAVETLREVQGGRT